MAAIAENSVYANGLNFHYLEAGSGPLLLCLHGFPDHAHTFQHQLTYFSERGFRVVAPFQRGYAPTGIPADGCYQTAALAQDALALITALGHKDAVIFGHDWGAPTAYGAAILDPKKVTRLITAAVPHGPSIFTSFVTNPLQQRRSWYMFFFQMPFAEAAVAHDDFRFIAQLWREWSPTWAAPTDVVRAVQKTLAKPGTLVAALGYYRCALNPTLQQPALAAAQAQLASKVTVPTLYLHGADDGCIGPELAIGMDEQFTAGLTIEIVAGAGHFLHQEKPDLINAHIARFLKI